MYRPTVRYDETFRDYVESLFHATKLDRNQILRLALYLLPHSKEGKDVLKKYLKTSSLPSPSWEFNEKTTVLWYGKEILEEGRTSINQRGEKDVNEKGNLQGCEGEVSRQDREVYTNTEPRETTRTTSIEIKRRKPVFLPRTE